MGRISAHLGLHPFSTYCVDMPAAETTVKRSDPWPRLHRAHLSRPLFTFSCPEDDTVAPDSHCRRIELSLLDNEDFQPKI